LRPFPRLKLQRVDIYEVRPRKDKGGALSSCPNSHRA